MFTKIDKAVAAVVAALAGLLATMGLDVDIDPYMQQMLIGALTTFLVWLVPNKR